MNDHLSPEQFARCFVGGATEDADHHIRHCSECHAELERLGGAISSFRSAVRGRIEAQVVASRPVVTRSAKWRPALATAAAIAFGVFPFVMTRDKLPDPTVKPTYESESNALMEAVSIHVLRTMPAPMERVIVLLPHQESTESGGTQ